MDRRAGIQSRRRNAGSGKRPGLRRSASACSGWPCPSPHRPRDGLRHRAVPDPHPPDQHPGHRHLGESGTQHGAAIFAGGWAISQLWLFRVAPIIDGIPGAVVYRLVGGDDEQTRRRR